MDTQSLQKASWVDAVLSFLAIVVLTHLGYAIWLHASGHAIAYQIQATSSIGHYMPSFVISTLSAGGFMATMMAIEALTISSMASMVTGVALGALTTLWYCLPRNSSDKTPEKQPNLYSGDSTNIFVTLPARGDGKPLVEHFLRLDRAKLPTNRPPSNAVEKLELAAQEILAAHRTWPADPVGHHSTVPLYEHSVEVARKLKEKIGDPLSRVIGLTHDIGKLLAYRPSTKRQDAWDIVTASHDQLSANIIRLLPEFKELGIEDQETLRSVLKYYHHPQTAPARTSQRARLLIQKLRFADSLTTYDNQQTPKSLTGNDDVLNAVSEALMEVIPTLNINKVNPDINTDGFTGIAFDFVAILEYPIRLGLAQHIREDKIVRALALRSDRARGQVHPASEVIYKALQKTGLLLSSYNGITPELGRFTIMSGSMTYTDCYLLNRTKLEKIFPEAIGHWGITPPYKLRVKGASRGISLDGDQQKTSEEPTHPPA